MNEFHVLNESEAECVYGGLIIELAMGLAGLAITEFGLGYAIGKDLAANER